MLDHMTFRVADLARSTAFYAAALTPLGYTQGPSFEFDGQSMQGFIHDGKLDTWLIQGPSPFGGAPFTTACHLAWRAATRAQVDAFYAAALAAGGRCNGAPGLRPHYHPNYYGAFVIDPDGNNIEAVCHEPV
ncbi:VOC family protein [Inhella proteolytica]|uniref:VOC family protein n=1 Tax=Inhella proteolytica TaxID=2795029 RepID=A0A931J6Z3_9BURK|nr:VOC family protein [Inhella proteolytica]MBH9579400.1 VOC family protein [Inhella proteolytica]